MLLDVTCIKYDFLSPSIRNNSEFGEVSDRDPSPLETGAAFQTADERRDQVCCGGVTSKVSTGRVWQLQGCCVDRLGDGGGTMKTMPTRFTLTKSATPGVEKLPREIYFTVHRICRFLTSQQLHGMSCILCIAKR